jgi:hypothetical protein
MLWVHCVLKQPIQPISETFVKRLKFVPSTLTVKGGKFMSINNVFASPIAVLPLNLTAPKSDNGEFNVKIFTSSLSAIPPRQASDFFETDPSKIRQLCLFPLEPHNMCLKS